MYSSEVEGAALNGTTNKRRGLKGQRKIKIFLCENKFSAIQNRGSIYRPLYNGML